MSVTIDGTHGVSKVAPGVVGNAPAFKAKSAGGYAGSGTKVLVSGEVFDTDNCYDTTLCRFTPNVPGYYLVTLATGGNKSSSDTGWIFPKLYKNGVDIGDNLGGCNFFPIGNGGFFGISGTAIVYMNGTTDYLEMYYISSGTFVFIDSAQFEAHLVRNI